MTITNSNSYSSKISIMVGLLLLVAVATSVYKPEKLVHTLVFCSVLFLLLLMQKFTLSISKNATSIDIVYMQFFCKKKLSIPLEFITFNNYKDGGNYRTKPFAVLEIKVKSKIVYSLDSRDGFSEIDLKAFAQL